MEILYSLWYLYYAVLALQFAKNASFKKNIQFFGFVGFPDNRTLYKIAKQCDLDLEARNVLCSYMFFIRFQRD